MKIKLEIYYSCHNELSINFTPTPNVYKQKFKIQSRNLKQGNAAKLIVCHVFLTQ